MSHNCRVCGRLLIVGKNITQSMIDKCDYMCRECRRKHVREYRHLTGRCQSMSENKSCPSFLGVHVAERLLPHVFESVIRMPMNNPGYDFICGGGFKIDVKSACRHHRAKGQSYRWYFNINYNEEAHYFLCIGFDDRDNLNPEHIWLIPGEDVNDHDSVSISETTLDRWSKYELTDKLGEVISCCNTMKNENGIE